MLSEVHGLWLLLWNKNREASLHLHAAARVVIGVEGAGIAVEPWFKTWQESKKFGCP